jgi:TorA maturation chaperone TorD
MSSTQAIQVEAADQHEESARADMYGFLATLFFTPPSSSLLDSVGKTEAGGGSTLEQAWEGVAETCRHITAEQVCEEYHQLFIGVSRPEVMLYGSYYLSGFLMEKPLAELRSDLKELGLARPVHIDESEDHISLLCEVMRYLILSEEHLDTSLLKQRQFYSAHMQGWVRQMCDAIENHPQSHFYKRVASLARNFFDVESQAFEMA